MKVIMTGGGTGGHIYPAIAIADKIKERYPESEILFVGTRKGLESSLVPKNGYDIKFVTVSGFDRKNMLKNFKTVADLAKGNLEARSIIKAFKPDIVIGTGGYVCGPVVRAAAKMGVKTYIHEQNAFPGATNRLLEKYVQKIFLAFEDAEKYFKEKTKHVVVGNPVRQAFYDSEKNAARKRLSIPQEDFVILSFGGSRGARTINSSAIPLIDFFSGRENTTFLMATGNYYFKDVQEELKQKNIDLKENIRILEYIDNMPDYLSAADVILSRSGALTISEIAVCGKASILIPSPNVTGNHQYYNAKALSDKGGAILISESELSEEKLLGEILSLMNDKEKLNKMGRESKNASPQDAAGKIVEYIVE